MALLIALLATAQVAEPRVTVSAATTREHVSIENGEGTIAGTGASVSLRVLRFVSLEGEVTAGSGEVIDVNRVAKARTGVGIGVSFHSPLDRRVAGRASIGLGTRRYEHHDLLTGDTRLKDRGGPYVSAGLPIALTRRVVIEPEARWLFTIADELFMVRSFGVKAGWRF